MHSYDNLFIKNKKYLELSEHPRRSGQFVSTRLRKLPTSARSSAWTLKREVDDVVDDSHIQRIVLATEETTVTQQVSHRPSKCQSRLWSQRSTKVNRSHHGDNLLIRQTGIQIATKSYATLQAIAPINVKWFIKPPYSISRATSIDSDCCRLPTTSVLSNNPDELRSNQF